MRTSASKAILLAAGFSLVATLAVSVQAHTLREVVQETVITNPDVQITTKVKRASHEQVKQARAGYFPVLDVNAAFGRERAENQLNIDGDPGAHVGYTSLWRRELDVELRENLFHGFETWYEVKRTKAKTDANGYLVCATAQDQALLATQAYIAVLRDRELVQIARRNLDSHRTFHSMIRDRGESGVGREADMHQIDGRLALAKSNLMAVENNLANSEAMYFRVTGLEAKNLDAPPIPSGRFIPKTLEQATTLALRYHPKMRIAVVDVEQARAQHNVSFRSAFPVIDVVATAQNDRNVNGVEGPDNSYRLMGELHYNLFRGGADMARQRETAYLTQEAAEVRNRTCRQVVENMRLAWNAMETSGRRLPLLREHSRASQESLSAYTEQFKLSKRSLLDVLDTENERFSADSDYCRGRYDALYSLYRVVDGMGQVANFLGVTLPNEAHETYNTYQDIAGPVVNNRQYDAGLQLNDFPSKYYHSHEPINPNQPYVPNYDSGITREFANEQIGKVFTPSNKTHIHSFKAIEKQPKESRKESKRSTASANKAKKTATKSQAKLSEQDSTQPSTQQTHSANTPSQAVTQTAAAQDNTHHHNKNATSLHADAAREVALQSTADALANQQNDSADRFSANNNHRQSERFANASDSNPPKLTADDFANDSHQAASNDNAHQMQDAAAQQNQSNVANAGNGSNAANAAVATGQAHHQQAEASFNDAKAQAENATNEAAAQQHPRHVGATPSQSNEAANQQVQPEDFSAGQQHSQLNQRDQSEQAAAEKSTAAKQAKRDTLEKDTQVSAASPATQKLWAVKVGRYTSDNDVKKSVAKLQNNGFNGFIKEIKTAEGTTTEVFAGPTAKRSAALDIYNQLKKAKISGNVVSTEYNEQQS